MKPKFCAYCGTPLEEGCECLRELAEAETDMVEELENRPDTQYGWHQQDLLDQRKFEQ